MRLSVLDRPQGLLLRRRQAPLLFFLPSSLLLLFRVPSSFPSSSSLFSALLSLHIAPQTLLLYGAVSLVPSETMAPDPQSSCTPDSFYVPASALTPQAPAPWIRSHGCHSLSTFHTQEYDF